MSVPAYLSRPTVSIAYLQLLVEILAERGIPAGRLLAGQPIAPQLLEQPEARVSAYQWTRLVIRGLELTGDPGLGYEYGLRMRPTAHGVVGYASMTCTTMRQAMEISVRYARVRQAHFTMHLQENADHALLELREKYPIPVLRSFFIENILLGLVRGYAVLLAREPHDIDGLEIWFDWPEPAWHAAWASRLPPVRFSMPVNGVRLSAACLALRPVLADPHASQQAIALCERELALAADAEADIAMCVRALLVPGRHGGYPPLDEVASRLAISGRTLKRRLQQAGTSFLLMLEEARRRDAHALLAHTELSVQDVAARLGYLNPANFSRAFNQWTGESPTTYRVRMRSA